MAGNQGKSTKDSSSRPVGDRSSLINYSRDARIMQFV